MVLLTLGVSPQIQPGSRGLLQMNASLQLCFQREGACAANPSCKLWVLISSFPYGIAGIISTTGPSPLICDESTDLGVWRGRIPHNVRCQEGNPGPDTPHDAHDADFLRAAGARLQATKQAIIRSTCMLPAVFLAPYTNKGNACTA